MLSVYRKKKNSAVGKEREKTEGGRENRWRGGEERASGGENRRRENRWRGRESQWRKEQAEGGKGRASGGENRWKEGETTSGVGGGRPREQVEGEGGREGEPVQGKTGGGREGGKEKGVRVPTTVITEQNYFTSITHYLYSATMLQVQRVGLILSSKTL